VVQQLVDPDLMVDPIQPMYVIAMVNALHRNLHLAHRVKHTTHGGKPAFPNDFAHLEFLQASLRMRRSRHKAMKKSRLIKMPRKTVEPDRTDHLRIQKVRLDQRWVITEL
jgi:hypothetical protein